MKSFNHAITPKRGDYNLQHIYFGTVQSFFITISWWANERCPSQEEEEKKTFGVPQLINMRHKFVVIPSSKEITTISQSIVSHLSKLTWKNWSIFSKVEILSHTRRKDWKLLARLPVQLLTSYQDHQSSSPYCPSSDKGLTMSSKVSIHNTSILEVALVKLLGKISNILLNEAKSV